MRVLLDTCTLIWWATEPDLIPGTTRQILDDDQTTVFLSAVTPWELAIKLGKDANSISAIAQPIDGFIADAMHRFALSELSITIEQGIRAGSLPLHHRDPFDRMLIAQALAEDIPIATPDPAFAAYGVKLLWQ